MCAEVRRTCQKRKATVIWPKIPQRTWPAGILIMCQIQLQGGQVTVEVFVAGSWQDSTSTSVYYSSHTVRHLDLTVCVHWRERPTNCVGSRYCFYSASVQWIRVLVSFPCWIIRILLMRHVESLSRSYQSARSSAASRLLLYWAYNSHFSSDLSVNIEEDVAGGVQL